MTLAIARLLARPGTGSRSAAVLPVIAFAIVTALLLVVSGGAQAFWSFTGDMAMTYQVLAIVALALLVVPLISLGGSAARLSARRRDDRLSTLRLLGATPGMVARLTVLESTGLAFIGAIGGVALYLALAPLVGLIPFQGTPLGFGSLLLAPWAIALVIVGICAISAISALVGLRGVIISPLGVRTRQNAPKMHWLRIVIAFGVIVIAVGISQIISADIGVVILGIMLTVMLGGTLAVLNLAGPWILRLLARRQARRATTAVKLLAARTILESPKAAWRQVSGVAMTSFVAVSAGSGVAMLNALSTADMRLQERLLTTDIGTGVIITVVISFIMVACSIGVNQAADVFDRGELYMNLKHLGMPREMLDSARERSVFWPLCVVAIGSALIGVIVALPAVGMSTIVAPGALLTIAASIAGGIGLVWVGMRLTRPVLTSRLALAA